MKKQPDQIITNDLTNITKDEKATRSIIPTDETNIYKDEEATK